MTRPPEPPRKTVTEIVAESNRQRMALDADAVRSLERLLATTMREVRQAIIRTPRGLVGERYRRELLAGLEIALDTFRDDYKVLLDAGILANAKLAEVRERAVLDEVMKTRKNLTFEQFTASFTQQGKLVSEVSIQFGQVPVKALEKLYERTYKDGLKLSQRLYNLDQATRFEMRDIVARGLATGQSARKMAAEFAPILEKTGVDNVRYKAMRIARTEINAAYREGHVASATDEQGKLQPWIAAIGWRLSASHPRVCICFRAGTRVETINGPKPIEEIQEGDMVRTHTGQYQPVTHLYRNTFSGSLLRLCFRAGRNRTHELIVTPNHPVLTDEGWLRADALKMGCRARSLPLALSGPYGRLSSGRIDTELRGKPVTVELVNIEHIPTEGETVYNLEVDQDHTYFAEGISVHNCDLLASDDSDGLGEGNYLPENVPDSHPNCFAAGTVVETPQVEASTVRWYEGEIVEIETVSGNFLTVTPNHPILTSQGWVAAGLLKEGCDVVRCVDSEAVLALIDPDNNHIPALIEDVAEAFGGASGVRTRTVPVASEDFHGDGAGCKVCIVGTDGLLRNAVNAEVKKPLSEQEFLRRHSELILLSCLSSLAFVGEGIVRSTPCGVGIYSYQGSSLRAQLIEPGTDAVGHRTKLHSLFDEHFGEGAAAASQALRDVLEALAALISADKIRRVFKHDFKGHVYNLQTVGNWYIANNIVAHNCLCYLVSILASMPEEQFVSMAPRPDEVPASQRKYYGFDVEE